MLTVRQAAARLGVTKYTIYRLIHSGALPAVERKIGRERLLVEADAVDSYAQLATTYQPVEPRA